MNRLKAWLDFTLQIAWKRLDGSQLPGLIGAASGQRVA